MPGTRTTGRTSRTRRVAAGNADAYRSPMASTLPDAPQFEAPVYGTIFAERAVVLARLSVGDRLILVADPPGIDEPSVWVHAPGGDVVGHLAPDINGWLVPRMLAGARYGATVSNLGAPDTASWKRLVVTVRRA